MNPVEEAERAVLTEIFRRYPDSFVWIGGSLLHLLHHSPRASLDLDLTPLPGGPTAGELAHTVREAVEAANSLLGTNFRAGDADETVKGLIRIRVEDPPKVAFSVDVSRIGGVTNQLESVLLLSALGSSSVRVPAASALLAQKLRALLLRRFPRAGDLFDCWFLLSRGVELTGPQRQALSDEIEAAGISVDQRFESFEGESWIKALSRAGVGGLNKESAAHTVNAVRAYLKEIVQ